MVRPDRTNRSGHKSRVIQCDICILDLLNNIIIGINELYVCKYLLDLDLTLMNIWRDNYCLENDYDSKMKLSIIFSMLHKFHNNC